MTSQPMVDVSKSAAFGPIELTFTDRFTPRWTDRKSGGTHDGGFWQPKPPAGFYALGGLGVSNYDDPNGKNWAICVKAVEPNALAKPLGYERIWIDKKSGARDDGSCWHPKAPPGYKALGDVFMLGHNTAPSLDDVRCVRDDLVAYGPLGNLIWSDVKTGAQTDFAAWQVVPPTVYTNAERGAFAANTYFGFPSHTKPSILVPLLALPFPVKHGPQPAEPILDSRKEPARQTHPQVDRTLTVPWTAIMDPDVSKQWQLQNSPFYTIDRSVYYRLELFNNNTTSENQLMAQEIQVGVTRETSQTWEVRTGVSVTAESGVSFLVSATVSATVSVELGFSSTTSVSVLQSKTLRAELLTPSGHAAALWDISYILMVKRGDGTPISQNMDFSANGSFLEAQFPPPDETVETGLVERYFALADA